MTLKIEEAISRLAKSLRERTLVPFCGAGVSVCADPPLPLAKEYLAKHGFEDYQWSEGIAQLVKMPRFMADFRREFGDRSRHPSEQHRLLACLDVPYYVTTNYDDLLEKSIRQFHRLSDDQVGVINRNDVSEVFSYRNLVIKLHGDIESNELLVLSQQQYHDRIKQSNDVDGFVKLLCSTHTVLFVGYSVKDINVLGMLGSIVESATRYVPPKYALLNQVDERTRQRLEEHDVTPIDLEADESQYNEKVCDFLYRLWEQNKYYGAYTEIIEKAPESAEESLAHAMTLRQNNQLAQARKHLKTIYENGVEMLPISQLPALLWLIVSIEDKREEWSRLEDTDEQFIKPLLTKIEGTTNSRMVSSLKAVYYSALAIAFCRAGDYKKAFDYLMAAGDWRCTNTADRGYQIVTANQLTAYALVLLHCSTERSDKISLLKAAQSRLEEAWLLFEKHGQIDTENESHHLGRFYGTMVFVTIACLEAKIEQDYDKDILLENARRAHSGPEGNRTRFGRVAGLYCEAVCHYWLAKKISNTEEVKKSIFSAKARIANARDGIDEKQRSVLLKLDLLEAQLSKMDGTLMGQTQSYSEDRLMCLPELLRDKVKNNPEEWLLLPLN